MNTNENITFEEARSFTLHVLDSVKPIIDPDIIDFTYHYINHDEYEMAFEGLFLEIIKHKNIPSLNIKKCQEIAVFLKLNQETVYDMEFWSKFENFCKENDKP